MMTTMRAIAIVAAISFAAIAAPRSAAAQQTPAPTPTIDLDGVWELDEHGLRKDDAENPIVLIKRWAGTLVTATFLTGAECADGTIRDWVFSGDLAFDVNRNPQWSLSSSGQMWVCSGNPTRAKECSKPGNYKTSFTNADVAPDLIKGKRTRQVLSDSCGVSNESTPTGPFALRRLEPCEFEERTVRRLENDLRDFQNTVLVAHAVADGAMEAARERYGPNFRGQPTANLEGAYSSTNVEDDLAWMAWIVASADGLFESPDWITAKAMAADMARDTPPLDAATALLEVMNGVEALAPKARQTLRNLEDARAALQRCLRARPR